MHAECVFADFSGYRTLHSRGSVSMLQCTFQNNNITQVGGEGAAIIKIDPFGGDTAPEVGLNAVRTYVSLSAEDVSVQHLFFRGSGVVFCLILDCAFLILPPSPSCSVGEICIGT